MREGREIKGDEEEKNKVDDSENKKPKNILGASQHTKDLVKQIKIILKKITQKPKKTICKASNKTARKHRSIVKEEGLASPNILILGPRGTGKELVAKEIHDRISAMKNPLPVDSAGKKPEGNKTPNQKKVPYVSVNCAAIATNLFESEMFGHVKGAFTGADHNKQGKVELAEGGVLFLDEIGDLSLDHQAKLLRFFQEREYTRNAVDLRIGKSYNYI